jgi:peptidoglycan hydrolase-like protein with peptidoglycan-binding domain
MQPKKFRILSAITAGSLTLAVVAITASSGTTQPAKHAALAGQTESFPPVNLDACPTLHTGYPTGGCVAQLQTDLNSIQGNHLAVDGTFGSVRSQTYAAVIAFQGAHGLKQDGMVGPATKQEIAAALPGSSMPAPTMPAPTVPPATVPPPTPSQAPSTPSSPALADDPAVDPDPTDNPKKPPFPYPFDIPALGNCPPLFPLVFKYSNGVYAPQGCVASLQQSLDAVGFGLKTTGDYGRDTYAAVWNFQLAHSADYGLSATGRADSSTISALDKIANSPAALGNNGANENYIGRVRPPLPAPISTAYLQTNTQPTIDDPPDDCATTCEDGE